MRFARYRLRRGLVAGLLSVLSAAAVAGCSHGAVSHGAVSGRAVSHGAVSGGSGSSAQATGALSGAGSSPAQSSQPTSSQLPSSQPAGGSATGRAPASSVPKGAVLARPVDASRDASMGRCPLKIGNNTVKGSVTNRHSGKQDYAVQVTWVGKGRGGSVTAAAVLAEVAPGHTGHWQLTATLKAPASQCLLAVQRGTLR